MGIKEQFRKSCRDIKNSAKKLTGKLNKEYKRNIVKNKIEDMYTTLGKIRYNEMAESITKTEESAKIFDEIKRLQLKLEDYEEKSDNVHTCRICGKRIPENISYCPYCGTKTEQQDM